MLFKNILFAAGMVGAATAQAADAGQGGQKPSGSASSMMPKPSGAKKMGPQVPADLSGGFKKDQIDLKIKFVSGEHKKKGKKDKGTMSASSQMPKSTDSKGKGKKKGHHGLTLKETTKAPHFYLGKADGANEQSKWVIVMIDTTDDSKRMLHYVRSDYMMEPPKAGKGQNATGKAGQDMAKMGQDMAQMGQDMAKAGKKGAHMAMKLNSTTAPQMQWMAPGSMGDSGAKRMYTFLMYSQQGPFPAQGMPQQGQPIDMKQWVQQNGLQPAVAGKTVAVDTTKNGTTAGAGGAAGSSGSSTGGAADKVATGSASSFHAQAYTAGAISAVLALSMALL